MIEAKTHEEFLNDLYDLLDIVNVDEEFYITGMAENLLRDAGVEEYDSDIEIAEKIHRLLDSSGIHRFVWDYSAYPSAILIVDEI